MKVVEKALEKTLHRTVTADEMQFGFMLERGKTYAVIILTRLVEEEHAKEKKLYKCSVVLEEVFDRKPSNVLEWAIRKKGMPEALAKSVMKQYEGAKTSIRMDSELSGEFEDKLGMQQGSVLSPINFAVVADVVTEYKRGCAK